MTNENLDQNLNEDIKEEKENLNTENIQELDDSKEEIIEDAEDINIEEEISKLKSELEDLKLAYLRKQAEFQNYSKRKENEYSELKKYASESIIKKLLPNLDNLERALLASETSKDFDALHSGIVMIMNTLKDILKAEGVEEINASGIFDPLYHHAVMIENSDEHEDNEISKVLEKGYTLNSRVIRPAMVTVFKKN